MFCLILIFQFLFPIYLTAAEVYFNDFESSAGSEWSNTSVDVTPVGNRRFLGQFNSETISLNLSGLPGHSQVTVSLDLFIIRNWEGSAPSIGPDLVSINVQGGSILLNTTFSNLAAHNQAYPDSYPGGNHPAGTGASEIDTLGYTFNSDPEDSVYPLSFTFSHTADNIILQFSGSVTGNIADESWGVDNVRVELGGELNATPDTLTWGHIDVGETGAAQQIVLANPGTLDVTITNLTFSIQSGVGHDFIVTLDGNQYIGGHDDLTHPVSVIVPAGGNIIADVEFSPTETGENIVSLDFQGNFLPTSVLLSGTGGGATGDPFLHVVITVPDVVVDYDNVMTDFKVFSTLAEQWLQTGCGSCAGIDFDGNKTIDAGDLELLASYWLGGTETVFLEGSFSHTHEPNHVLAEFEWSKDGKIFSNQADTTYTFPTGQHTVSLKIIDDNNPPRILSDSKSFVVASVDRIPGSLLRYYRADTLPPSALLTAVPAAADYAEQPEGLQLQTAAIDNNVMIRFSARIDITANDFYDFQAIGGSSHLLLVDGVPVTGPVNLDIGTHDIDARFALDSAIGLPLEVTMAQDTGPQLPIDPSLITHDLTGVPPVINQASPLEGSEVGGNVVLISGLGFFPEEEVVVHWGAIDLSGPALSFAPDQISLNTPSGSGLVTVSVETSRGVSNTFQYTYAAGGPLPINFSLSDLLTGINKPTTLAWGPDGRLYVATQFGEIHILTLDDLYNVTNVDVVTTISSLSNPHILGIGFNPFDPPGSVRLYVCHSLLFANGGSCFTGFSPYSGQISILEGPNFNVVNPLITALPVSNHDHSINGIDFDQNGDLYVAVGGNTNAGIPDCALGDLPGSPLSGAILKAVISKPAFNGHVIYWEIGSNPPIENNDQVFGNLVRVADGVDVSVYAPGLRNPYDLAFTTSNLLYATDNGPNNSFGAASTGPTTQGPDPTHPDELNLVEFDQYYGHPNRTRGVNDSRQNIYRNTTEPSIPGDFTQVLTTFASSTNGLVEYRAAVFNSAMRHDLLAQKLNGVTLRLTLSPNGRSVVNQVNLPVSLQSLDITTGPGGVILGAAHGLNKVVIAEPIETVAGLRVFDIYPWRAPAAGGNAFTIGGKAFGDLTDTSVTIGGLPTVLTSVSGTRIRGVIPVKVNPTGDLLDVIVTVGAQSRVLSKAFRYLKPAGTDPYSWRYGPALPVALGEVACGVINEILYVVGEGSSATLGYNIAAETWTSPGDLTERSFAGHHHPTIIYNNKLYLMGGLNHGSGGKVQIYDPNSDTWSLGADMPWAAGSASAVLIGDEIYVAGGIVGSSTVTTCGKYNPNTDSWTLLANMTDGRNHAACATDGQLFYVFGGRGPGSGNGNVLANGFADVQIYDPVADSWESSNDPGSTLAPLPQARGGTGTAVYANGEFFVFGGETSNGPGATPTRTYDRVDIYDPVSNSWRPGATMPTALHGLYPVLHNEQIYIAGGGTSAGNSQSTVFQIYVP